MRIQYLEICYNRSIHALHDVLSHVGGRRVGRVGIGKQVVEVCHILRIADDGVVRCVVHHAANDFYFVENKHHVVALLNIPQRRCHPVSLL